MTWSFYEMLHGSTSCCAGWAQWCREHLSIFRHERWAQERQQKQSKLLTRLVGGRSGLHLHYFLEFLILPTMKICCDAAMSANKFEISYKSVGSNVTWFNAVLCEENCELLQARTPDGGGKVWSDDEELSKHSPNDADRLQNSDSKSALAYWHLPV